MKRSNWFFLAFLTVVFAAIITFGPAGCAKPLTEEQRVAALQQNAADTQAAEQAKANAEAKLAEAKAAGKLDTILVGGVDATADALAAMEAGELEVTVFQDASGQGGGGVAAAIKLINGETVDSYVDIPYQLVTPANIADFQGKN